jgi:hypothetical protein
LTAVFALAFVTGLIPWIVSSWAQGICIKYASDYLEKGQANLQSSFNYTTSKILSIMGASTITGILIFVGTFAFVIPGLILAIMFSLVVQSIVIENTGALESLSRSRRLVSGRWLKTFGLLLVLGLIIGIVAAIAGVISAPLGIGSSVLSALIGALIQPILPIGMTLYYYSNIARNEPPAPPPPPS